MMKRLPLSLSVNAKATDVAKRRTNKVKNSGESKMTPTDATVKGLCAKKSSAQPRVKNESENTATVLSALFGMPNMPWDSQPPGPR